MKLNEILLIGGALVAALVLSRNGKLSSTYSLPEITNPVTNIITKVKSEPIQTLNLQDGAPLMKINEVDDDSLRDTVLDFVKQLKLKDLKDWTTKEIEDTIPPSPTDLNQTEN